jgi:hypothetical protein
VLLRIAIKIARIEYVLKKLRAVCSYHLPSVFKIKVNNMHMLNMIDEIKRCLEKPSTGSGSARDIGTN